MPCYWVDKLVELKVLFQHSFMKTQFNVHIELANYWHHALTDNFIVLWYLQKSGSSPAETIELIFKAHNNSPIRLANTMCM